MPQKPKPTKARGKGFTLRPIPDENTPAENAANAPVGREPFEHLGELPHGYGMDTIFLIAQEPKWLFTYWDIDINRHPGGAAYLRAHYADGTLASETEVPFETRNWYLPVEQSGTDFYVEIGYYRGETWNLIARSGQVTTPPEGLAPSEAFDYATIPFHLSFQRLLDHLQTAQNSGENLLDAVSRMQQKGDFGAFGAGNLGDLLSAEQQSLLRALLGPGLLEELGSGDLSSAGLESRIRAYLEEMLSSGGSSEALSSFHATTAALVRSGALSSFGGGSSWEIGALSSWMTHAILSWTSAGLELSSLGVATSWSTGVGSSAETSWSASAPASWGSASPAASSLASWMSAGLSSWLTAAQSSGQAFELTSWAQAASSSWLQNLQSSWAEAALSSWNSPEFSSWFSASAVTSWSGASETLSSAQTGAARDFFLHVNAEVIFYGGTDPRARVTVAGQPITLQPDGSFRYHFVFPNADYEIPVVAASPDGVETRSATLRFHRDTTKVGFVTDTPQPPLGTPMGPVG